uniref:Angiogenic factor with G patch and FHA domains 1 n=1 Tax=Schistocephalus solidus TaxID=70667 RepID=A0A0V0JB07_SCHSO
MEFDIFEKISDLETKIHFLRLEIVEKDAHIKTLQEQNLVLRKNLESRVPETDQNNSCTSHSTTTKFDKQTSTDPEIEAANAFDQATGQSIADILKETSENVMQTTGYVFDQKTGLYFDKISGYYYDPENQLFFEPRSGVYYSYNSETKEYTYHSRISSELRGQFKRLLSKSSSEQNERSPIVAELRTSDGGFSMPSTKSAKPTKFVVISQLQMFCFAFFFVTDS